MADRPPRIGRSRPGSGQGENGRRRGSGPTLVRLLAVRVLERVERSRAWADIALHHALAQSNLASADRRLATELVYGTLRWRGRIDYLIQEALDRKLADLEPLVHTVLRLGAYQIHFSDRIPDNAAVDESVRCARALGAEAATGLVNAVLRRISTQRDRVRFPDPGDEPIEYLESALSLPRWLAERWLMDYGLEAASALARASNLPPPLTIRANEKRGGRETLLPKMLDEYPEARPTRLASQGIVLGRKGDPGRNPLFLAGEFTIQDEASQAVLDLLDPSPDDRVLDVCAAPGTKTTGIAERLSERGRILALDRHEGRLKLVARSARRLGLGGISTLVRDATLPLTNLPAGAGEGASENGARFDRALVDAPCSGLGALRRNPDARWRILPRDPAALAQIQREILARSAEVISPGGSLVYSTCTVLREENEDIVEAFLTSHPNFQLAAPDTLPAHLDPVLDDEGFMRCHPHVDDTDGFFAVRLERRK